MRAHLSGKSISLLFLLVIAITAAVVTGRQPKTSSSSGIAVFAPDHTPKDRRDRKSVRSVTIPVVVRTRGSREESAGPPLDLTVLEDGDAEETLSIRGADRSPLELAVLIQENVVSSVDSEISYIGDFIRHLPPGSRVLIGYLGAGSLRVRQRFTTDLKSAARSLHVPMSVASAAPYNPFDLTVEALKRFDSLPTGRRAVLMISDGLDLSHGFEESSPGQSIDLQRAINEAQRRGIAVYAIYEPTVGETAGDNSLLVGNAQGSLQRLADDTGGRAFFQGTQAPVSIQPFLHDFAIDLNRQVAVSYLSTHPAKGFHKIKVRSLLTDADITHPSGYTL